MGYHSTFEFGENEDNFLSEEVLSYLKDYEDYEGCAEILCALSGESLKFYDCEEVMKKLSVSFKESLFYVYRKGEGSMDVEAMYFKNGKEASYCPDIVWPEFKEEDLK